MDWTRRIGRLRPFGAQPPARPAQAAADRPTPGIAALFESVSADRSHAVLDLGPAAGSSLRVYGRYARWVRFADTLGTAVLPGRWETAFANLSPNEERPFDIVVAWDILDRLPPAERPRLVRQLAAITAPDTRLFALVASTDVRPTELLSYTLSEVDWVRYEGTGLPPPGYPPLLPAGVQELLEPFQVKRAFTTQQGWREYVAVRDDAKPR